MSSTGAEGAGFDAAVAQAQAGRLYGTQGKPPSSVYIDSLGMNVSTAARNDPAPTSYIVQRGTR